METFLRNIQGSLDALLARTCDSTELELEYKNDLDEFGADTVDPDRKRRHAEWFLLERASDRLGGVPLEAFKQSTDSPQTGDEDIARSYAAMRASRVGVFLVNELAEGEGLLIEDLLGRGRYEILDPVLSTLSADEGLAVGDLIVGRIYPHDYGLEGDKTTWAISPAATTIRNDNLVVALERDIQAMRQRNRGPLHISQRDLESMFFTEEIRTSKSEASSDEPVENLPSSFELEEALKEQLGSNAISKEAMNEYIELLRRTPMHAEQLTSGGDDPAGWILDEIAFESDADLGDARKAILALWAAFDRESKARDNAGKAPIPTSGSNVSNLEELDEATENLSAAEKTRRTEAIALFDKGREDGRDIDALFRKLETDLDIIGDPEEEESSRVPDFPGVLGALMQEFLWDCARLQNQSMKKQAAKHRSLELFVQYGSFLGLAEELSPDHIEIFLSRWLWEVAGGGDYDLAQLGSSLGAFCKWLEEHHGHEIWKASQERIESACAELPRLQKLNVALGNARGTESSSSDDWHLFEYVGEAKSPDSLDRWLTHAGATLEAAPPAAVAEATMESGDLLLGKVDAERLVGIRVYPASAAPYLKATS